MLVHWYPGHMAKAKRRIQTVLRLVDACVELADARAPWSSRNPELARLAGERARLVVLARADLADEAQTLAWLHHLRQEGEVALAVDLRAPEAHRPILAQLRALTQHGAGKDGALARRAGLPPGVRLAPQLAGRRALRVLVMGIPNVGKSTLINRLSGRAATRTGARPGVTRGPQWIRVAPDLEVLDTPGLFVPRLDNPEAASKLAWLGVVPDEVLDVEEAARLLLRWLAAHHPEACTARYGLDEEAQRSEEALSLLAARRGLVRPGGRPDTLAASTLLLRDFRQGRLGRLTLEAPPSP